ATSVGMPIPRFTTIPARSSRTMRRAISSLEIPVNHVPPAEDEPIDVDAGSDDAFPVELRRVDDLVDLRDHHVGGSRHDRVEVALHTAVDEVAELVGSVRSEEREIRSERALEEHLAAIEHADLFAFRGHRPHSRWRVEAGDACAARPDALRQ